MADHIRVAIITDTHIGYKERDPLLSEESFEVFEEELENAKLHSADIVIHAGDLFDEINPSRSTTIRTMKIVQKYVVGEGNPPAVISAEGLTSDPNWLDPNIKIKLPIFVMHGNHDQPSGYRMTAASELLSVPKLINFFKSPEKTDEIRLQPVVLQRGCIRLIIYGLGYIYEYEFTRILTEKKLILEPPPEADISISRTFTILMVHQNRTSYGKTYQQIVDLLSTVLPSQDQPNHVDLVVWGHEHENLVERTKVGTLFISQPGSSICTQIKKAHATERSMAILDINRDSDSFESLTLTKARKLIYETIDLSPIFKDANTKEKKINSLKAAIDNVLSEEDNPDPSRLPLVRIMLNATGTDTTSLNLKQLSFEYQTRVANPETMIRVQEHTKQPKVSNSTETRQSPNLSADEHLQVEDILKEKLPDGSFEFLSLNIMNDSLKDYVHSDNPKAFENNVTELFRKRLDFLQSEAVKFEEENNTDEPMTEQAVTNFIRERKSKLPEPTVERIAEIDTQKKTSAFVSPQKQNTEKSSEEDVEATIIATPKKERPKRKVSRK